MYMARKCNQWTIRANTHRNQEADVHADERHAEEGSHAYAEIELVDLEEPVGFLVLYQPEHGGHDDGGQGHQRGVAEQRGQEQKRQHHAHRHHYVRHRRPAPSI